MRKRSHSERALFLTLWLLLFVGFMFWNLPKRRALTTIEAPRVDLSEGIKPLFESDSIARLSGTDFKIELIPSRALSKRRSTETLQIGYELRGEQAVLERGVSPSLVGGNATAVLTIPNPKALSPRSIRLFLATD